MPVNATPDDITLLESNSCYTCPSPKVRYIRNAFVTNIGLVLNSKGLVKECCHYNWDGQLTVCLADALGCYYDTEEYPENLLMLDDDETYLVIHNRWHANYYHWLNEAIYRLWIVKDKTDQMILLLPAQAQLSKFVMETLKPFSFKSIVYIPEEKSVQVNRLCLPTQKQVMECYSASALHEINKMYVKYIRSISEIDIGKRVFLSRKNCSRRKILNEDEVITTMRKYDFTIIYSETYTFFEQVALFSKVEFLAGNHGAGLTNMVFMPPGATVFELVKRKTNPVRHQSELFWYMADAMRHKYYHQICEPVNADELFFTADIMVDIELLDKNLEMIIRN